MSSDELWSLHEEVVSVLANKIAAEKDRLDQRLRRLDQKTKPLRRSYPQVLPKYQNPARPDETWAGRGKRPRWVAAQLRSGKKLEQFRIRPS
jgi:DNA-binding protein H-NS